jgi:hypothetical protein
VSTVGRLVKLLVKIIGWMALLAGGLASWVVPVLAPPRLLHSRQL